MYYYKINLPWGHSVQLDTFKKYASFRWRWNRINNKQWEIIMDFGWFRLFITNAT